MSLGSTIEWTDASWNPVTGCSKVSDGCVNCYAEAFAERWRGKAGHHFEKGFDVVLRPDRLDLPLKWQKPQRIFVNSMSDLFHDEVPDSFIQAVFTTMAQATRHTFQILTKRPQRMQALLSSWKADGLTLRSGCGAQLPNVWLGVSVEDQAAADERIPLLLQTPAVVRFLSCEPLLGPVEIIGQAHQEAIWGSVPEGSLFRQHLHWVICGGESGPKARPMHPAWARSLRDQCQNAGVPFFFKQWGDHFKRKDSLDVQEAYGAGIDLRQKKGGLILDGCAWDEFPGGTA